MKLIATMAARNEDWCLGYSLRAVLQWCDEVVVLNHASTDGTPAIIAEVVAEHPDRVRVRAWETTRWTEMAHRQFMLETARSYGATHIAIVDADEVLTANQAMNHVGGSCTILQLPWVCLARDLDRYYASGIWYDNWVSTIFRDQPNAHWAARSGYDFHHRHPMGVEWRNVRPVQQSADPGKHQGGLMHLQFLCETRVKAKQLAYQMQELLRWPGREPVEVVRKRYSPAIYESDPARVQTAAVPAQWWEHGLDRGLIDIHRTPWQLDQCQRWLTEHGRARFEGLDFFGLF